MKAVKFRLRDVGWHLYGFDQRHRDVDDMEWWEKGAYIFHRQGIRKDNFVEGAYSGSDNVEDLRSACRKAGHVQFVI